MQRRQRVVIRTTQSVVNAADRRREIPFYLWRPRLSRALHAIHEEVRRSLSELLPLIFRLRRRDQTLFVVGVVVVKGRDDACLSNDFFYDSFLFLRACHWALLLRGF